MRQRVWGWRYGLLQILVALSSGVSADSLYRLVPPKVYVVFGGDLEVMFHVPGHVSLPNAFVRLQGRRPRDNVWLEITTMGLPLGRKTGTLSAACGIVEFAGRYSLTMLMQVDGPVLTEVTFTAVWPSIRLRLPDSHFALTSAVTMEIGSDAACASRLQREFLTLELYFQRVGDFSSDFSVLSNAERIATDNFTTTGNETTLWTYPCEIFDLDGHYQVLLKSSTGTTLTVSNVMTLTFSASYHLSSRRLSVFPCAEGATLNVLYTRPPCSGEAKFRLHKLVKMVGGSAASPLDRVYLGEFEIDPDRSRVRFGCSLFETDAMGYCFLYVTKSKSGTVVEQKQLCLPAQPNAVLPQDGAWSMWTSWTTCSVSCGSGKRSRFRMCNSPLPQHGGRFCTGQAVQWSRCRAPCPDLLPRTPLRSPTFDPTCYCGCTRTVGHDSGSGQIIATGRCDGLAVWIIRTPTKHQVTLTFRYYDVLYEKQWVKIRDGATEEDDLLFFSRAPQWPRPPRDVTSANNVMRVELMTSQVELMASSLTAERDVLSTFPQNATVPIHVRGFIASYSVTAPDDAGLVPPLFRHVKTSVMQNDVTIVGLVVVGVVAAVVVGFAVVQRKYWGLEPKYVAANCEESPAHMKHSSSAQSSQPSSPGPQVQVDMDIPLTGGSGTRRKNSSGQRAASRTSSISSTCSTSLKKIRTFAAETASISSDRGGRAREGSPKPSTKEYNSLETPDDAHLHQNHSVVRTSPMMTPRSPKVHPHRLKASPGTPALPLPSPITKQEMLTRKRLEREGVSSPPAEIDERPEVMGASWSCPSSTPSTSSLHSKTTTRAEINVTVPPSSSRSRKSPSDAAAFASSSRLKSPADPICLSNRSERSRKYSQGGKSPRKEEIPLMDSVEELHPHQLLEDAKEAATYVETSFISLKEKARRPTSLTDNYSLQATGSKRRSKSRTPKSPSAASGKLSAMEERQTLLPKPDGQSPKSSEEDMDDAQKGETESRTSSPSKSSSVGTRSNRTMSPSRSIASPELEYDDFIMDDPLSYFEYEELSRLNWTGTEKIGKARQRDQR